MQRGRTTTKTTKGEGNVAVLPPTETQEAAAVNASNDKSKAQATNGKAKDDDLSFWDFAAGLGDRWLTGDLKTYIYRCWPKIDRQQERVYIAIVQQPIDEQYLLENFGSGRYLVMLKDRHKLLRKHTASVHNRGYPPQVDPSEVIDDPANNAFFKSWGKKANGSAEQGKKEVVGETSEILRTVYEHGKVDPALVDLWKDTAQQRDQLAKLLSDRQANAAPTQAPPQPDLLGILASVKTLQADPLAMLEKLKGFFPAREPERPKAEPAPTNSLDELKKVLEVFGQAKTLFTPEAAPEAAAAVETSPDASAWENVAVQLPSQMAPIIGAIANLIAVIKTPAGAAAPMAAGMPVAAPTVATFNPYDAAAMQEYLRQQKAAARPQSAPAAGPSPVAPAASYGAAAAPGAAEAQPAADDAILAQVAMLVSQAINCMNRGIDGHVCADAFIDLSGELAYDSLVAQIKATTVPVVVELAKSIPELKNQVTSFEEQLKVFITEFVAGPEYIETQETVNENS
jgi:hypothetical protein